MSNVPLACILCAILAKYYFVQILAARRYTVDMVTITLVRAETSFSSLSTSTDVSGLIPIEHYTPAEFTYTVLRIYPTTLEDVNKDVGECKKTRLTYAIDHNLETFLLEDS